MCLHYGKIKANLILYQRDVFLRSNVKALFFFLVRSGELTLVVAIIKLAANALHRIDTQVI